MLFVAVQRDRFKEKVNPNGWQLNLKIGTSEGLHLIDNSRYSTESSVNGNRVYDVISGSLAAGSNSYTTKLGFFYPDLGIIALDHKRCSDLGGGALFLGTTTYANQSAGGTAINYLEKAYTMLTAATYGRSFQGRAEEDISSTHYFIRVKNSEYNFSNNPTFSTNVGQIQNSSMIGDPTSYITTVGLYNEENELVATAKLSKPLAKTFAREATIRVKLDY